MTRYTASLADKVYHPDGPKRSEWTNPLSTLTEGASSLLQHSDLHNAIRWDVLILNGLYSSSSFKLILLVYCAFFY